MRLIRVLLLLAIGILAYNYWAGSGWTLPTGNAVSVDADVARQRATQLANEAAAKATHAATTLEGAMSQSALTAKIKSKMALDHYVKAREINVDTSGSVVTLSGTVTTREERARAVRLARETEGVTQVIDRLDIK